VERIELVELIEWQKSKLSPRARELWDELDALIYLSDDDRMSPTQQEYEVMNRLGRLPRADKRGIGQLRQLRTGLYASDHAEGRGEPGEPHRIDWVKAAAVSLDVEQGRQAGSYTTVEEAVARLHEDG
jgi:hypothetical protein